MVEVKSMANIIIRRIISTVVIMTTEKAGIIIISGARKLGERKSTEDGMARNMDITNMVGKERKEEN